MSPTTEAFLGLDLVATALVVGGVWEASDGWHALVALGICVFWVVQMLGQRLYPDPSPQDFSRSDTEP